MQRHRNPGPATVTGSRKVVAAARHEQMAHLSLLRNRLYDTGATMATEDFISLVLHQ